MSTSHQLQNTLVRNKIEENPLLPLERKLSTREEFEHFLVALEDGDGYLTRASREMNVSPRTVYHRLREFPAFGGAVKEIRERFRKQRLEVLEGISFVESKKPENFRERKFLMESLHPGRYRSTFRDFGPTAIQINLGVDIPLQRFGMSAPNPPETGEIESTVEVLDDNKASPEDHLESMDFEL